MSDTNVPVPIVVTPAEPTLGQKFMWSLPATGIAIIAVLVASFVLYNFNKETRTDFNAALKKGLEDQEKKTAQVLQTSETKNKELADQLTKINDRAGALEKDRENLSKSLDKFSVSMDEFVTKEFTTFKKGQEQVDKTQHQDISKLEKGVGDLDRRIVYVEDKLKKLDDIGQEVLGLRQDTGNLKKDYVALREDVVAVGKKADVTKQELADLDERARLFQLRVLAARAREAADAARSMDLRELMKRLSDAEGK